MEITAVDMQNLISDLTIENTNLKGENIALKRIINEMQADMQEDKQESTEE